jgi:hypothetical protein
MKAKESLQHAYRDELFWGGRKLSYRVILRARMIELDQVPHFSLNENVIVSVPIRK